MEQGLSTAILSLSLLGGPGKVCGIGAMGSDAILGPVSQGCGGRDSRQAEIGSFAYGDWHPTDKLWGRAVWAGFWMVWVVASSVVLGFV